MKVTRWTEKAEPTLAELKRRMEEEGLDPYRFDSAPGAFYPEHTHSYDEVRWVVSGRMRFGIGSEVIELGPGDRLDLPAFTPHWAETVGEEVAVMLAASKL